MSCINGINYKNEGLERWERVTLGDGKQQEFSQKPFSNFDPQGNK